MKKCIKCLVFIALLVVLLCVTNNIFSFKYGDGIYSIQKFYDLEDNTVDLLVLGSSHAFENINPAVLWEEHGIAAYDLCGSVQPLWNTYFYFKEALKTQTPKLVILEAYATTFSAEYSDDSRIIKNTYGLKPSSNKIEALKASIPPERMSEFALGLTQYHTRYNNLTKADFLEDQGNNLFLDWKGFGCNMETAALELKDFSYITETEQMSEKTQYYYEKILDLANDNGIPMLVLVSPYAGITEKDQRIYNEAARIALDKHIFFCDFNGCHQLMGLDVATDLADENHLNYSGNQKYTKYLGEFLCKNYYDYIVDRRGDDRFLSWQRNAEYFRQLLYNESMKSTMDGSVYLNNLENENYLAVISMKNVNLEERWIKGEFAFLGIENSYVENSMWVVRGKKVIEHLEPNGKTSYHIELSNFSDLDLSLINGVDKTNPINYNNVDYSKLPYGINICIYDMKTGGILDSVWLNTENDLECVR